MANIIDKMIVKEILSTMRNDKKINDILPDTTRILLERILDDDIEQLEAEIMLDTIIKLGGNTDK